MKQMKIKITSIKGSCNPIILGINDSLGINDDSKKEKIMIRAIKKRFLFFEHIEGVEIIINPFKIKTIKDLRIPFDGGQL